MFELIATLTVGGFGAIYLWNDYKRGFVGVKALGGRVHEVTDRILHGPPTPQKQAEMLVANYASQLDAHRTALATMSANKEQSIRIARDERRSAKEAREMAEEALKLGDDEAASVGVAIALNAEERASMHEANAENYAELEISMRKNLDTVSANFEVAKTMADTVRVQAEIAEANNLTYESLSEVSRTSGGFTAMGELKILSERTERAALTAAKKVELAQEDTPASAGNSTGAGLLRDHRIQATLEEMRKKIALNPGNYDFDEGSDNHHDGDLDVIDTEDFKPVGPHHHN